MANIYSTPVESQFVPTYAPMNLDAINIGAQAMQKRQDENFAQLDLIDEQARTLEKKLFEQDKPVFQEAMGGIRNQLDQLAADGDVSDAGRKIRSLATRFKERASTGALGNAFQNYEKVQQKYKQIDESDLSDAQKTARKNAIIAGYKGAQEGGLDLSINTDDIDFNEWIDDTLGDVNKQRITEGTDWNWNSKIGKFEKGEITTEGIPPELLSKTVMNSLTNDPTAMSALRQRARVATAGQDEFVIEGEDGEAKIVSREEKMQDLIAKSSANLINLGQQTYGQRVVDNDTSTTAAGEGATGVSGVSMTGVKRGQTMAMNIGIDSFDDAFSKMQNAQIMDKQQEADEVKGSLSRALQAFVESDNAVDEDGEPTEGNITRDDAQFLMNMGSKISEIKEKQFAGSNTRDVGTGVGVTSGPGSSSAGRPEITNEDLFAEELGAEQVQKYYNLKDKFDEWVADGGGWTDRKYFAKNEEVTKNITDFVANTTSPMDWKIYGKGDVETQEFFEGDEESVWSTFRFNSVAPPNDYAPTMISGTVEKDGQRVPIRLVGKKDPAKPSTVSDPTDVVLERMGNIGLEIKEQRNYEDIMPGFDYQNVVNKMPRDLRGQATNDYVGLRRSSGGFHVQYGDEDEPNTFTTGDLIGNIYKHPTESNMDVRSFLVDLSKGNLTDEEIATILDSGGSDELSPALKSKLENQFNEPYEFKNKISAIEAGATYSGL